MTGALVLVLGSGPSPAVGVQQPDDGQTHVSQGVDCRAPGATGECGADPYSSLPAASGPHDLLKERKVRSIG